MNMEMTEVKPDEQRKMKGYSILLIIRKMLFKFILQHNFTLTRVPVINKSKKHPWRQSWRPRRSSARCALLPRAAGGRRGPLGAAPAWGTRRRRGSLVPSCPPGCLLSRTGRAPAPALLRAGRRSTEAGGAVWGRRGPLRAPRGPVAGVDSHPVRFSSLPWR